MANTTRPQPNTPRHGTIVAMAALNEITKAALRPRLTHRASSRWPQLSEITVAFRGRHAYISAALPDNDEPLKLCRLTWQGSPDAWRFAIYEYSHDQTATPTASCPAAA